MDKLTHRLKNYIKTNTVEAVTYSLMFVTVVLSSLLVSGEVSIALVLILLLYVAISLNLKSISEGYTGIEEKLEDIKSAMNIATKDRGSIKKNAKRKNYKARPYPRKRLG